MNIMRGCKKKSTWDVKAIKKGLMLQAELTRKKVIHIMMIVVEKSKWEEGWNRDDEKDKSFLWDISLKNIIHKYSWEYEQHIL